MVRHRAVQALQRLGGKAGNKAVAQVAYAADVDVAHRVVVCKTERVLGPGGSCWSPGAVPPAAKIYFRHGHEDFLGIFPPALRAAPPRSAGCPGPGYQSLPSIRVLVRTCHLYLLKYFLRRNLAFDTYHDHGCRAVPGGAARAECVWLLLSCYRTLLCLKNQRSLLGLRAGGRALLAFSCCGSRRTARCRKGLPGRTTLLLRCPGIAGSHSTSTHTRFYGHKNVQPECKLIAKFGSFFV